VTQPLCLVTGPTGYVGGRLVPELLAAGYRVRCLARDPGRLRDYPWFDQVETVGADASDAPAVAGALDGVDVAYYLIHSLGRSTFEEIDAAVASTFATAARDRAVSRLIYLGGLAPASLPDATDKSKRPLSPHLRSREEVGQILLASGVPTVVLRAAVILGSGSASFEMLRHLTERLPAMITPSWVQNRVQPIAIRDVLRYLVACADLPAVVHRSFDIGGPDVLTYADMMRRYAVVAGLPRRLIVPTPLLSPTLSSHWVGLVTPVPRSLARPLVESLTSEAICTEDAITTFVPEPGDGLIGFDRAVSLALQRIRNSDVATRWSSASLSGAPSDPLPTDPGWSGGSLYVDRRERRVTASAAQLWSIIEGIGGDNGWYSFPLAWWIRGVADRLMGGVGLRRGRRDPRRLYVGETVDFWRVETREPGRLLRLRAEMKLPGLAWLELGIRADDQGITYEQRAIFHPRGLMGHLYWWSVRPFHGIVFGEMTRHIASAAGRATPLTPPDATAADTTIS
jgi:uncharacterized protein YbjT (DUF2867 family)